MDLWEGRGRTRIGRMDGNKGKKGELKDSKAERWKRKRRQNPPNSLSGPVAGSPSFINCNLIWHTFMLLFNTMQSPLLFSNYSRNATSLQLISWFISPASSCWSVAFIFMSFHTRCSASCLSSTLFHIHHSRLKARLFHKSFPPHIVGTFTNSL